MDVAISAMTKIALSLLWKFMTEKFVSKMVVIAVRNLSKSTENKIDDQVANSIDEALGYPCGKPKA